MRFLTTLFLVLILLFGLSCDNITEPVEILSTTEQYTRILSRDGFWMWDSVYTDKYIEDENEVLWYGYIKTFRLYYSRDGTFYSTTTYETIDRQILIRESVSKIIYKWRIIEEKENEQWAIEYRDSSDNIYATRTIISLDMYKFHRSKGKVYTYVSNK